MSVWFKYHTHYYIQPTTLEGWSVVIIYFGLVFTTGRLVLSSSFESICAFFLLVCFYTLGLLYFFFSRSKL